MVYGNTCIESTIKSATAPAYFRSAPVRVDYTYSSDTCSSNSSNREGLDDAIKPIFGVLGCQDVS